MAWKRMEAREADDALLSSDLPAAIHTILTAPRIAEFWLIVCLPIRGVRRPAAGTLAPNAAGA